MNRCLVCMRMHLTANRQSRGLCPSSRSPYPNPSSPPNPQPPVTTTFACCRDLHAACRTPFNALSCPDVDAFCKDDAPGPKLLAWAQHKLHRAAECSAYEGMPYEFVPLDDIIASNMKAAAPADDAAAAAPSAAATVAAALRAAAARALSPENRVAVAVVGVGALLVAVAVAGMAATLRGAGAAPAAADGGDEDFNSPLLHTIPEVPVQEEAAAGAGALRHVVSSNYMLSGPASQQ